MTMSLGQALRARRQALGWTQRAVADRVGLSPQYLHDLELDRRGGSDPVLERLAATLGLSAEWLYYLAGRYPPDLRGLDAPAERVLAAWQAFRAALADAGDGPAGAAP